LETVTPERKTMKGSLSTKLHERVMGIETTPSTPAVLLPLLGLLGAPAADVDLDEIVRLVSYDNAIAGQCLRVAASPLFGLSKSPETVKSAVISLGLRRVETILITCCLGQTFQTKTWPLDPIVFWRHSLGCAMVCRRFAEKLASADPEKAYTAGLLHDIGFLVNCMAFPEEFTKALEHACAEHIPLNEAELAIMGFTHCDAGRALAEKWKIADDLIEVIAHHHAVEQADAARPLVAIVHLSDLLCRMRGLDYGYYENHKVDLVSDPAWAILAKEHRDLEGIDLARFTFSLDEAIEEIHLLVNTVFGAGTAKN
jgi:putative nucleotidyltransferase with HDIG domain